MASKEKDRLFPRVLPPALNRTAFPNYTSNPVRHLSVSLGNKAACPNIWKTRGGEVGHR